MVASDALGRQFTVVHCYDPDIDEGMAHVYDRGGAKVHELGYARRPQWDKNDEPIPGSQELSGFQRYTESGNERKGYATAAQEAVIRANPGVRLASYEQDISEEGLAFRAKFMKTHPDVRWDLKPNLRM